MRHDITSKRFKIEKSWGEENSAYIYWIFGVLLLLTLFDLAVFFIKDLPLKEAFGLNALIMALNLLIIPFVAVNTIYLFKLKFISYCNSKTQFIFVQLVGLIIGVLLGTAVVEYISYLVGIIDDDYIGIGTYQLSSVTTNFVTNLVFSIMIGVPVFLKQSHQQLMLETLVEKELELDKAYQLKIQSELEAIHAKINPHFLYNSLNSIVSLIHEDPDKAEKMVLSLSDLFRYSINSGEGNFSTIKKELDIVRAYLEIEYVRFQDQLEFEIIVSSDLEQTLIPKFLIQPLIENGIKHGTSKINQGILKLEILRTKNDLLISVFDNGPNFPENIDSGYGLKSTVDKLELLYPDAYSFKILNLPVKRIEIKLKNIFNPKAND